MTVVPASFRLAPIDEAPRDGRYQLVFGRVAGRGEFALVRWTDQSWRFTSGLPLHFEPESYRP